MSTLLILLVWSGSLVSHDSGASSTPPEKPSVDESRERSRSSRDRAIAYLLESQNPDGSWGGAANATFTDCWSNPETQRSWRVATTGLACMALLEAVDGDWGASDAAQRERGLDAVDRGLDTLIDGASLEQCEDWDLDNMWGYLYGLQGLARALANDRFGPEHRKHAAIRAAAGIH
ncbi:MAG: hypothetical protein KDC38_20515, partial [Planctomycetes bacterium]|nr:hypothetical protein [Planctomycetota bacterium]